MTTVRSIDEIDENARTLLRAAHGASSEKADAVELIAKGRVYYPLQFEGQLAFVPSRFIGYRNNSIARHNKAKSVKARDGKETNPAIARILGKYAPNEEIEERLREYCEALGVVPSNHTHKFWRIAFARSVKDHRVSAMADNADELIGNDSPRYRDLMRRVCERDDRVRRLVLRKADGKCEFKGCKPFNSKKGVPYLEAHHVIHLSASGKDKPSNVIALCANHHREAHYGENWEFLNEEFLRILKNIRP